MGPEPYAKSVDTSAQSGMKSSPSASVEMEGKSNRG